MRQGELNRAQRIGDWAALTAGDSRLTGRGLFLWSNPLDRLRSGDSLPARQLRGRRHDTLLDTNLLRVIVKGGPDSPLLAGVPLAGFRSRAWEGRSVLRSIIPLYGDNLDPLKVEIDPTRSEQAISASELSYRRLFEAAMSGILILPADTDRMRVLNSFLVEIAGKKTKARALGRTGRP